MSRALHERPCDSDGELPATVDAAHAATSRGASYCAPTFASASLTTTSSWARSGGTAACPTELALAGPMHSNPKAHGWQRCNLPDQ